MRYSQWLVLGIVLVLSPLSASAGLVEDVRSWQQGISTVTADFTQSKRTELLDRPIKSSGRLLLKLSHGIRWEYRDAMDVIYDGSRLYIHYIELEEVVVVSGVSGYAGPLSFDVDSMVEQYDLKAEEADGGVTLHLTPRNRMPFASMQMAFKKGSPFPHKVLIIEESGDLTTIRFKNVTTNALLDDGLFKFIPPAGVTIRERTLR